MKVALRCRRLKEQRPRQVNLGNWLLRENDERGFHLATSVHPTLEVLDLVLHYRMQRPQPL
jgi:hypothetical protein